MKEKEKKQLSILAEIASMYYEHDMSQSEIAKKMFYSKAKVSRMLKKAKESNIVEIKINYPLERVIWLEEEIKNLYHVNEVIILKDFPEYSVSDLKIKRIAKITAEYIEKNLKSDEKIGLSWGRTLEQVIYEIRAVNRKNNKVIQVVGASSDNYNEERNSMNLVRKLSEKWGCDNTLLYAPLFVENHIVKEHLVKEKIIAKAMNEAAKVDCLLSGIGGFDIGDKKISWAGYFDEEHIDQMKRRGAVGFFCGHFIDKNGEEVFAANEDNIIGISLEDIRKIKHVIAVSGGVNKAKSTAAALKGGYIDCLITDEFLASKLIPSKRK